MLEEIAPAGRRRGRGQRAQPPATRWRRSAPTSSAAVAPRTCSAATARRLLPVRTAGRLRRRRAGVQGVRRTADGYVVTGTKAWITHGGTADFYNVFARTAGTDGHLLLPGARRHRRATFGKPEEKMGLHALPTRQRASTTRASPPTACFGAEGAGSADRVPAPRLRPARHRRRRRRPRPGRPRRARRLRPGAGARSASRSSTTRASASCSPTWPPPSSRAGDHLDAARRRDAGRRTPAAATSRSSSPPTPR